MNWLPKQVTEGRLQSVIQRTYRLGELAQAHADRETAHVRGKLVAWV